MTTDPFGLTEELRQAGWDQLAVDDLKALGDRLLADMKANLERLDSLPDGTLIYCYVRDCTGHPVEILR